MNAESVKKLLKRKRPQSISSKDMLRTGSTLLDLALSGRLAGGLMKGTYVYYVGDTSSGKTWQTIQLFSEASRNPEFDEYRFIHDNVEYGALMNIRRYFGKAVDERMEPPAGTRLEPICSATIEDLYFHLDDAINDGRRFIYIADSMDALTSVDEENKFQEQKKAYRKGREMPGSYGDGKAKKNSTMLRKIVNKIQKTGSILVLISQTRDNIGFGAMFNPKTRSGGNALSFYATVELWSSVRKRLKKKVNGKDRQIGSLIQMKVKKNRISGKEWTVEFPIYFSYGIDDLQSCINFLIEEGHWATKAGKIRAPELDFMGTIDGLIKKIEAEKLQEDLRSVVGKVWKEVEDACVLDREPKYG